MADPQLELDRLCARLARTDAPLDDVARARAEARLEAALDAEAREDVAEVERPRRRRGRTLAGAAVAVALVAGLAVALSLRSAPAPGASARLLPYLVAPSGAAAVAETPPAMPEGSRLDVPDGWLVRATLGAHVTLTAIGPAALSVEGDGDGPVVRLERGRLLAELEPGEREHRELRVRTADAEVRVIGTLFAVEASGDAGSVVSVRHGRVRVRPRAAGAELELAAGRSWHARDGGASSRPIDEGLAAELDEHERLLPPDGAAVPVVLTGAPSLAEVWLGGTRVATTPAWLRLPAGASVRLSAAGFEPTAVVVPGSGDAAKERIGFHLVASRRNDRPEAGAGANVAEPAPAKAAAPARAPHERLAPSAPAPSAPSAPAPSAPAPVPPTAAALYALADRSLAAGDRDGARAALLELVRRHPDDALADAAGFDLASMALDAGELDAAARYLAAVDAPGLAEPREYLACRIEIARHSAAAVSCLTAFRRRHPRSPHDADALAQAAILLYDREGCAAARPLLEEYLDAHADGPLAAALRQRLGRCPAAR